MCRIAGIINNTFADIELKNSINSMCEVMKHGGPDDHGVFVRAEAGIALGHRRLSILDLSQNGHQPMLYSDSRYVIVYNGELYNFMSLKNDLVKLGYSFSSDTDTEVILAAYASWGEASFAKLNGMFSFAIYDQLKNEIILARDAAGIKPLYYAHTSEGLAFASEVRAFKGLPYLNTSNKNWSVYLLAYGHMPEPYTTLEKVQSLEKGTYIKYHLKTSEIKKGFFHIQGIIQKITDKEDAIKQIRQTLDESVKSHLIADAPLGVFLSGGLDSSIIAAIAAKFKSPLQTNSIYFEDNNYSEKKFQDLLVDKISTQHSSHLISSTIFKNSFSDILKAIDMPCVDGINTWFISKYARESGLKAVLSGIGGDELYGGYPSFSRINMALALQQLPVRLLRSGKISNSKYRRIAYLSIEGSVGLYLFMRGQFLPVDIAKQLNADENEIWNILSDNTISGKIDYLTPTNQACWLELNMYLQNQLLRDADVMGMAHGLEIRVPFLEKNFLNLSLKIHSDIKFSGKNAKQLLIDAYGKDLPESIWNRPKMGFSFPFKEWFSDESFSGLSSEVKLAHEKMKRGNIHWSQFYSIFLLNYFNVNA